MTSGYVSYFYGVEGGDIGTVPKEEMLYGSHA
jgi:hypothetical protein